MMSEDKFFEDPEPLLATLARIFANEGSAKEVAILANSTATIRQTHYDNWKGGTYGYSLFLENPQRLYSQISDEIDVIETNLTDMANNLTRGYENEYIEKFFITPLINRDIEWRNKAKAWLAGDGISNQGRVRSDNIPSRTEDGLLFRSEPEIFLYKALKSLGVSFAPLPVFIRGGESYKRIELDFLILQDGIVLIVEVDGDTVHQETPAKAHARTTMLAHEGAIIERVKASECSNMKLAKVCANKILKVIEKIKKSR